MTAASRPLLTPADLAALEAAASYLDRHLPGGADMIRGTAARLVAVAAAIPRAAPLGRADVQMVNSTWSLLTGTKRHRADPKMLLHATTLERLAYRLEQHLARRRRARRGR